MAVRTFECTIARPQIARYLAGAALDAESLAQLTSHIAACAACAARVAAARREAALADAAAPGYAVVAPSPAMTTESNPSAPSVDPSWRERLAKIPLPKLYRQVPGTEPTASGTRPPMTRALLCGAGLVATLGVMSYFTDPTKLLGSRASEAISPAKPKTARVAEDAPRVRPSSRAALGVPLPPASEPTAKVAAAIVAEPSRPSTESPSPKGEFEGVDAIADDAPITTIKSPPRAAPRPRLAMRAAPRRAAPLTSAAADSKPAAKPIPPLISRVPATAEAPAPVLRRSRFAATAAVRTPRRRFRRPAAVVPHIASPKIASPKIRAATAAPRIAAPRIAARPRKAAKKPTPPAPAGDTIRIYDATRP